MEQGKSDTTHLNGSSLFCEIQCFAVRWSHAKNSDLFTKLKMLPILSLLLVLSQGERLPVTMNFKPDEGSERSEGSRDQLELPVGKHHLKVHPIDSIDQPSWSFLENPELHLACNRDRGVLELPQGTFQYKHGGQLEGCRRVVARGTTLECCGHDLGRLPPFLGWFEEAGKR